MKQRRAVVATAIREFDSRHPLMVKSYMGRLDMMPPSRKAVFRIHRSYRMMGSRNVTRLISIPMAAERYNVSRKTIYQWIYLGKIPCIRLKGHRTMFDLEELERWEREAYRPVRA